MLLVLLIVSVVLNIISFLLVWRFANRSLQFDELFNMLFDDIDTNTKYFDDLLKKPLFINAPEVITANKNMSIIKIRLEEFALRMKEISNRRISNLEKGV